MTVTTEIEDGTGGEIGPRGFVSRLEALAAKEVVSVEDALHAFGPASFVPMLLAPALVVFSPLSGIPFLPTVCGLLIALTAVQMAAGRSQLWLPGPILRGRIRGARLKGALGPMERVVGFLAVHSRDRLWLLVSPPFDRAACAIAAVAGLTMPFLELLPFTASALGLAVALLGLGFLTRDGLFVLAGGAVSAAVYAILALVVAGLA